MKYNVQERLENKTAADMPCYQSKLRNDKILQRLLDAPIEFPFLGRLVQYHQEHVNNTLGDNEAPINQKSCILRVSWLNRQTMMI